MDLRDSLNRYYYDVTVSDLRQISRTGGGELSYNSIMYLDVISYQRAQGECTVSTLANTLHITKSAVTIKVNENHSASIRCMSFKSNLAGMNAVDFPAMASIEDGDQDPQRDRPEGDPVGRISADDTVAPSL